MPYLYTTEGPDVAFHFKGGSTSMRQALGLHKQDHHPVPRCAETKLVMRDPKARLNSWLTMRKRDKLNRGLFFDLFAEVAYMHSWRNPHWDPVLPLDHTQAVRLEDLDAYWAEWFPNNPLEHLNTTDQEDLIGPYWYMFAASHADDIVFYSEIPWRQTEGSNSSAKDSQATPTSK